MWAAAHGQIAVVEFLLQNVRKETLHFKFIHFSILFSCLCLSMLLYTSKFKVKICVESHIKEKHG